MSCILSLEQLKQSKTNGVNKKYVIIY